MPAIVEAVDLIVGTPPSSPFSFGVATGEIVGLLFPRDRPRAPVLRVLAGIDAAVAGDVRHQDGGRVVITPGGPALSDALSSQPDLVLLDAANDGADRNTWARLASERAMGTSFVVATANVDHACHGDRVTLALWDPVELARAFSELVRRMTRLTEEFLGLVGARQHRRTGLLGAELRRLNLGSRALLGEMRRCARPGEEVARWRVAAGQVAGVSLDDRVLEAAIAESHGP